MENESIRRRLADCPTHRTCPELATRKPRLSLRLPGSLLSRLAARTFLASLFHDPPRLTRFEPVASSTVIGIRQRLKQIFNRSLQGPASNPRYFVFLNNGARKGGCVAKACPTEHAAKNLAGRVLIKLSGIQSQYHIIHFACKTTPPDAIKPYQRRIDVEAQERNPIAAQSLSSGMVFDFKF